MNKFLKKRQNNFQNNLLAIVGIALASIALVFFEYVNYKNFRFAMLDLGLFNRHMYSLAHLTLGINPLKGINLLGDHAHIFLIALAPFYALWQSPVFLLIIQVLAITLSAYPIYLVAKHYFGSTKIATAWIGIYLLFFGFWSALAYPFHDSPVAVLPLAWALYYLVVNKNYRRLAVWLIILCLVREDMPLVVTMFGVYVAVFDKKWRFGALTVALSLIYFTLVTRLFLPAMGNGTYLYGTNPFGGSLVDILKATFTQPLNVLKEFFLPKEKLKTLLYMLFSFGGLPLLAPKILILLIPLWMGRTFTDQATRWSVIQHYSASQAPILCVAAIVGLAWLTHYYRGNSRSSPKKFKQNYFIWVATLITVGLSLLVHFDQKLYYPTRILHRSMYVDDDSRTSARAAMTLIPKDASVAASSSFYMLSSRQDIYNFPFENYAPKTSYIIASTEFDLYPLGTKQAIRDYLNQLILSGQYLKIFDQGGTVVLKKTEL